MPYLTKDDILKMLKDKRQEEIVDQLLSSIPYVFRNRVAGYTSFRNTLAAQLGVQQDNILIIGSAGAGFSLDPDRFGNPFSPESDIDTVVIDETRFDQAWFELYSVGRRRRLSLDAGVRQAFDQHKINHVFFGFIEPKRLPGIVALSNHWFHTFNRLQDIPELVRRRVNGRLYRSIRHVRAHQLYSLEEIATKYI